jgi:hypothetical protein
MRLLKRKKFLNLLLLHTRTRCYTHFSSVGKRRKEEKRRGKRGRKERNRKRDKSTEKEKEENHTN